MSDVCFSERKWQRWVELCGLLAIPLGAWHLFLGTPQQSYTLGHYLFVKRNVERAIFLVNLLFSHAYSNPLFFFKDFVWDACSSFSLHHLCVYLYNIVCFSGWCIFLTANEKFGRVAFSCRCCQPPSPTMASKFIWFFCVLCENCLQIYPSQLENYVRSRINCGFNRYIYMMEMVYKSEKLYLERHLGWYRRLSKLTNILPKNLFWNTLIL